MYDDGNTTKWKRNVIWFEIFNLHIISLEVFIINVRFILRNPPHPTINLEVPCMLNALYYLNTLTHPNRSVNIIFIMLQYNGLNNYYNELCTIMYTALKKKWYTKGKWKHTHTTHTMKRYIQFKTNSYLSLQHSE